MLAKHRVKWCRAEWYRESGSGGSPVKILDVASHPVIRGLHGDWSSGPSPGCSTLTEASATAPVVYCFAAAVQTSQGEL